MDIAGFVNKIILHWDDIAKIILQLIGVASVIVKLTPTLKDDDVLKGIVRFLGKYIALNRGSGTGDGTKTP